MANKKLNLIDRKKVLENLDKFVNPMPDENGLHYLSGLSTAITEIVDAPTVDAAPVVHGRWEDGYAIHDGKEVYQSIDCSVCNEIFKIESHDREYWKERFKVCPFCGSQMDGGDGDG